MMGTHEPSTIQVESLPDLPAESAAWRRLGLASGNPFSTWEWASTWWRHFGAGREQRILGCREGGGELIGILPLYVSSRRPLRVLRFAGHGAADQLGPVCAPELHADALAALERSLAASSDWDLLLAERMPESAAASLPGSRRLRREPTPDLQITAPDWDAFLAERSGNFRSQARKFERRLERDQGLSYRLADDADRLEKDMSTFFALHEARWAAQGAGAFSEEAKRFHRDLARLALDGGWLRLWLAYLNDKPAAAWYGYRLGGVDWFYQQGRDPAWERASVGFVLAMHTIREAVNDGVGSYKFLLGNEDYKARFSTGEAGVETVALARGAGGRLALAAALGLNRLPTGLQALIRRLRPGGG